MARSLFTVAVALLASGFANAELTPVHNHAAHHDIALQRRAAIAAGTDWPAQIGVTPLGPLTDPFYVPPPGWQTKANGAILRSRGIKNWGVGVSAAYQILFKSQSVNGTALQTVTTVWVPNNAAKDRFVLAGRPDNSVSYACAPSWRFTNGTVDDQRYFDQGWIVTSVDHEGPDAAFGCGRTQGRLVLDAGRAIQQFKVLGLKTNPKVVIYGYSGGAAAAGWAATLKPAYAPELNVVGATYGGTPADLIAIAKYVDGNLFAGLGFLGMFGLAKGYSAVAQRLDWILTTNGKQAKAIAGAKCLSDAFYQFIGRKLLSYDTTWLGPGLFNDATFAAVLAANKLGGNPAETPSFPQYVFQGVIDEIIPVASVDALVKSYCSSGGKVVYKKIGLADHFAGVNDTDIVPFIKGRFENYVFPAASQCVYTGSTQVSVSSGVFNQTTSQKTQTKSDYNPKSPADWIKDLISNAKQSQKESHTSAVQGNTAELKKLIPTNTDLWAGA